MYTKFKYTYPQKMKNKQIQATAIIISAFLLAGCATVTAPAPANGTIPADTANKGKSSAASMAPVTPPELTEAQIGELKAGEVVHQPSTLTFTVVAGNFFYVPNQIKVKKGDTVKIVFQNSGGMHNFNIDEFNLKGKTIKTGETDTIEFVADKAGTFQYYCSIGSHRKMGQQGNLVVEE